MGAAFPVGPHLALRPEAQFSSLWINKHRAERQGAVRCEKRSNLSAL